MPFDPDSTSMGAFGATHDSANKEAEIEELTRAELEKRVEDYLEDPAVQQLGAYLRDAGYDDAVVVTYLRGMYLHSSRDGRAPSIDEVNDAMSGGSALDHS